MKWIIFSILFSGFVLATLADECKMTRVLHVLQYPGCKSETFLSYACVGGCTSYVQVSGSKLWQQERSCMCCQESGEKSAMVTLSCPNAKPGEPKKRTLVTKAPSNCMCRPCTAVEDDVTASELVGYSHKSSMLKGFIKF